MLRDGCRGERVPAVGVLGPHRSGAVLKAQNAWDALGGVLPAATGDGEHLLQVLLGDADAGKSAVRGQDDRALDAWCPERRPELSELEQPGAAVVLCRPDVVQSAERSYEAPALWAAWAAALWAETVAQAAQPKPLVLEARPPLRAKPVQRAEREAPLLAEAAPRVRVSRLELVLARLQASPLREQPGALVELAAQGPQRELAAQEEQREQPASRQEAQQSASAAEVVPPASAEALLQLPSSA